MCVVGGREEGRERGRAGNQSGKRNPGNNWEIVIRMQLVDCRDIGKSPHLSKGWPGVKGGSHWGELEVSGGNGKVDTEAYTEDPAP